MKRAAPSQFCILSVAEVHRVKTLSASLLGGPGTPGATEMCAWAWGPGRGAEEGPRVRWAEGRPGALPLEVRAPSGPFLPLPPALPLSHVGRRPHRRLPATLSKRVLICSGQKSH